MGHGRAPFPLLGGKVPFLGKGRSVLATRDPRRQVASPPSPPRTDPANISPGLKPRFRGRRSVARTSGVPAAAPDIGATAPVWPTPGPVGRPDRDVRIDGNPHQGPGSAQTLITFASASSSGTATCCSAIGATHSSDLLEAPSGASPAQSGLAISPRVGPAALADEGA